MHCNKNIFKTSPWNNRIKKHRTVTYFEKWIKHSTLPSDFQVEVLDWMGEDVSPDKDGSIEKNQIIQGEGYTSPNEGAIVTGKLLVQK